MFKIKKPRFKKSQPKKYKNKKRWARVLK